MATPSENPEPSSDGSIRNCPICMDPVRDSEQKFLSCAHVFHEPCIDRWLVDKTTCPVCRNQELKAPLAARAATTPANAGSRQWHLMPMVNIGRGIATMITTEVLPTAIRPRQQTVHGRRQARRRGTGPSRGTSRSRSRARTRSRPRTEPSSGEGGNDLA